jgi:hypothetical protein
MRSIGRSKDAPPPIRAFWRCYATNPSCMAWCPRAAAFADLVVAGAPALQIEDGDVVVPNRGLRLRRGRREFHVQALGLRAPGARLNVVVAAERALYSLSATARPFSFIPHAASLASAEAA